MDTLQLLRRLTGASAQLSGCLEMARMQNYSNPKVYIPESLNMLARMDDEALGLLIADLDACVSGIAWLKSEVESRRAAAVAVNL